MTRLLRALKPNRYVLLLLALLLLLQIVFFSYETGTFYIGTYDIAASSDGPTVNDAEQDRRYGEPASDELESNGMETWDSTFGIGSPVVIQDTRQIRVDWAILVLNLGVSYLLSVLLLKGGIMASRLLRPAQQDLATARAQNWLKGPGWRLFSALGLLVLSLLWLGLHPSFYYMDGLVFVPLAWSVMLVVLVLRIGVQDFMMRRHQLSAQKRIGIVLRYACLIGAFVAATVVLIFAVPMKMGFLIAEPTLSRLVHEDDLALSPKLVEDVRAGPYAVSAQATNSRREHRSDLSKRVIFILANDHEAGFIYSPTGIDDLAYNAGNKGHLFGNWYWMKED
ncbi:MAG: hypothetical protein ACYSYV_11755 [Planctomycetota bacterium]|jgi:hypothetical protein